MKKILLGLILILFVGVMIYSFMEVDRVNKKKDNLNKELASLEKTIQSLKEKNTDFETELENLKNDSKEKIEEYKIWEKAKQKLES